MRSFPVLAFDVLLIFTLRKIPTGQKWSVSAILDDKLPPTFRAGPVAAIPGLNLSSSTIALLYYFTRAPFLDLAWTSCSAKEKWLAMGKVHYSRIAAVGALRVFRFTEDSTFFGIVLRHE